MRRNYIKYNGCIIDWAPNLGTYVWEDFDGFIQSEGHLRSIEAAKRDIDRFFGPNSSTHDFNRQMEIS